MFVVGPHQGHGPHADGEGGGGDQLHQQLERLLGPEGAQRPGPAHIGAAKGREEGGGSLEVFTPSL